MRGRARTQFVPRRMGGTTARLVLVLALLGAAPVGSLPHAEAPPAARPMPRGAAPRGATCSGFRAAQVLRVRGGATAELAAGDEEAGDDAGVEDGGLNDGSGDEWLDEYFPEDQRKEWYAVRRRACAARADAPRVSRPIALAVREQGARLCTAASCSSRLPAS